MLACVHACMRACVRVRVCFFSSFCCFCCLLRSKCTKKQVINCSGVIFRLFGNNGIPK